MAYLRNRRGDMLKIQAELQDEQERSQKSMTGSKAVSPSASVDINPDQTRSVNRPSARSLSQKKNGKRKIVDVEEGVVEVEDEFTEEYSETVAGDGPSSKVCKTSPIVPCLSGKTPVWEDPAFIKSFDSSDMVKLKQVEKSIADVPALRNLGWRNLSQLEGCVGAGIAQRVIYKDVVDVPLRPNESSFASYQEAINTLCHGTAQATTLLARANRLQAFEEKQRNAALRLCEEESKKANELVEKYKKSIVKLEKEVEFGVSLSKEKGELIEDLYEVIRKQNFQLEQLRAEVENKDQALMLEGYDDGTYHIVRCLKASKQCPSLNVLKIWLSTLFDDDSLKVFHSEVPYSEHQLKEMKDMGVDWDPPMTNEINLRDTMEKLLSSKVSIPEALPTVPQTPSMCQSEAVEKVAEKIDEATASELVSQNKEVLIQEVDSTSST